MEVNAKTKRLVAALKPQSKSLLMTIFGDTIAARGGCVSIASLINIAAIFNITARNVRISMLRLVNEGWVESQRRGRYSDYCLSDSCRQQFEQAHERVYAKNRSSSGQWLLLLPGKLTSAEFRRLRRRLRWSGFVAAGSGVLIKPDNQLPSLLLNELNVADKIIIFIAVNIESPAMAQWAAASWDVGAINARYLQFAKKMKNIQNILAGNDVAAADAFVLRTMLIHEYRRVLLHDPMLPLSLLPAKWYGESVRAECVRLYKKLTSIADIFVETHLNANEQPLPPPADFYYRRFGGLPKGKKK